jgi:hypothetical protein
MQEPRRKMSARQRSRRGGSAAGSDDEAYYAAYGDEYGDYYGGYDAEPEEAYPLPEGKYGLECCVCGGSGPEVACCEVRRALRILLCFSFELDVVCDFCAVLHVCFALRPVEVCSVTSTGLVRWLFPATSNQFTLVCTWVELGTSCIRG